MEQERDQLQLELQRAFQEGSQSDISESVREQQKELIETLHHKNKQISSLLKDLEVGDCFHLLRLVYKHLLFSGKRK